MNIIAFIPSRYGSTRFPGKPLALIAGKPMIQHVYQCAKKCPDIFEVYVTTDDERIMQCVLQFKGKAIMTAKSNRSGSDRIAEAAMKLGLSDDNLIVNIQGDQPIFRPSVISDMVKPLIENPEIPMGSHSDRLFQGHTSVQYLAELFRPPVEQYHSDSQHKQTAQIKESNSLFESYCTF